ncbi:hypothetical protein [Streptomyces goshikiensis]|uniref:hypothetical protein n=1 Tax=Streptomyces goshikiensis TaxID=1942 RepID=UPI0033A7EDEB
MDWKAIATIAVGVIGLIGVLVQRRYNRAVGRDRAKADLDLLALLPEDSSVRDELRSHIDETIRHIISVEDTERRDAFGIALASAFLVVSAGLGYCFVEYGGWWLALAGAFFFVFGVVGLASDGPRRQRDSRGRRL